MNAIISIQRHKIIIIKVILEEVNAVVKFWHTDS